MVLYPTIYDGKQKLRVMLGFPFNKAMNPILPENRFSNFDLIIDLSLSLSLSHSLPGSSFEIGLFHRVRKESKATQCRTKYL